MTLSGLEYKSLYHSYKTKPKCDCYIESHRDTVDLQYCYEGGEMIGYSKNLLNLEHLSYDRDKDKDLWSQANTELPTTLQLQKGAFILFAPNQLHQPQQYDGENTFIEKIVLKIPSSMLFL